MIDIRKIHGVSGYPEEILGTGDWFCCAQSECEHDDLYDAKEIFHDTGSYYGLTRYFVHYPEGTVHKPFELAVNAYVGEPVWDCGTICFYAADFSKDEIRIYRYYPDIRKLDELGVVPLSSLNDYCSIRLIVSPLTLCQDILDGMLRLIWPDAKDIPANETESLLCRDGNDLYISGWLEDPKYHEYVVVKDYDTLAVKNEYSGYLNLMENGTYWLI